MNATCERLLGTLRRELLDRMLILSEAHLRAILIEYQAHYNTARLHQGIAQRVPGYECEAPGVTAVNLDVQRIRRKPVLNGLYQRIQPSRLTPRRNRRPGAGSNFQAGQVHRRLRLLVLAPVPGRRLLSRRCSTCILRPGDKMHLGPQQTAAAGSEPAHGPGGCRDAGEVRPA